MLRLSRAKIAILGPAFALFCAAASCRAATIRQEPTGSKGLAAAPSFESIEDQCASMLTSGNSSQAETCFQRMLREDPKSVAAHTYLGIIADTRGDLVRAANEFGAALQESPHSTSARNNYGVVLMRQGKEAEAARQFEASLKLNPSQEGPLINLATIKFSHGSRESLLAARELLLRARSLAPDVPITRSIVITDLRLNDAKSAADDYQVYSGFVTAAVNSSSSAESKGSNPTARRELGDLLVAGKLPAYGLAELKAAVFANPTDSENVLHLARAEFSQKELPSAGLTLESALARGLSDPRLYALLADVYEASGHIENAVPAMRLAIDRDPQNQEYRFRYGMLLVDTKAPQAGIMRLQEAVKLFPGSTRLWFGLGLAQFQDHKNQDAQNSFLQALRIDPNSIPSLTYLGVLALDAGRPGEAKTFYQRCIDLNPRVGIVHYLMSEAIQKEQSPDLNRAEAELLDANRLEPTSPPARLALGKLYLGSGREEQALVELQEAIRLQPGVAEAHYHLARAYQKLKRTAEAKTEFDAFRALGADEKSRAVSERRELVSKLANVKF